MLKKKWKVLFFRKKMIVLQLCKVEEKRQKGGRISGSTLRRVLTTARRRRRRKKGESIRWNGLARPLLSSDPIRFLIKVYPSRYSVPWVTFRFTSLWAEEKINRFPWWPAPFSLAILAGSGSKTCSNLSPLFDDDTISLISYAGKLAFLSICIYIYVYIYGSLIRKLIANIWPTPFLALDLFELRGKG